MELTIEKLSELWKTDKKQFVRPSTYATYVALLKGHVLPEFGHRTDITEEEAQDFVLRMLAAGLSAETVRESVLVLKMILRFGAAKGLCPEPRWRLRYPGESKSGTPQVMLTQDILRLLDHIHAHPSCKGLGIYISLYTGLRIGEVCGLRWGDIDMRSGILHVRRTLERVERKLVLGPPKTGSSLHDIPMAEDLLEVLRLFLPGKDDNSFVLSDSHRPVEPRSYRNYFGRLLDSLGIPRIRFHALRHSFATRCIETGGDAKTVSSLLGHANIKTTLNLYVHPGLEQKKAVVNSLRG